MKTFSFRFDIDSLADIEVGIPKLIELAKELDVRFTFFVNMGRSFNWKMLGKGQEASTLRGIKGKRYSAIKRLGLSRTLRTVVFNPNIGLSHKKILFKLLDNGHEMGLHGGMDHPLWQWRLDMLNKDEINGLLKPAYNHFIRLFGQPKGFASPGFKHNRYVLEVIDDHGFEYASDMEGQKPFRPEGYRHIQIPVNIIGPGKTPLVEHLCSSGLGEAEAKAEVEKEIKKVDVAIIYGHPAFEGNFRGIGKLLNFVKNKGYRILPMKEILYQLT